MPSSKDLDNDFAFHPPQNENVKAAHQDVRIAARRFMDVCNELVPDGREKALVRTKIQEAMMWANKGIAVGNINE